jgi:hypothetical protein
LDASFTGLAGNFELAEITQDELITEFVVFHEFILLPVHTDDMPAGGFEALGNMTANETGAASDADLLAFSLGKFEWFGHDDGKDETRREWDEVLYCSSSSSSSSKE